MNWQVNYALQNLAAQPQFAAKHIAGEMIQISVVGQPSVFAVISEAEEINLEVALASHENYANMDFLCGYRKTCVWHGDAIAYLERARVGWGNSGTLTSAALDGNAKTASHKTFSFSDRLLSQYHAVRQITREYDRIHKVTLKSGKSLRIGMIADYEPTADAVRTLWAQFGPVDFVWNINPNGGPSPEAIDTGTELGCEVVKWNELKHYLRQK